MANIPSFDSNRKFYGDDYFSYGIDRSGEFTLKQANLLIQHGWAYLALAQGTRVPATPEEETFVAVCRGEQVPETIHEKVWMLFCSKISLPKTMPSSPLVGSKLLKGANPEPSIDDDFESSTL